MPKFKDLKTLEAYLQNNAMQVLSRSADIERIIAEVMSQAVIDVVYAHYSPTQYERRMDDSGLSDPRNVGITDFGIKGDGSIFVTFENLTEGSDSMQGKFITDTIVEGIESNWNRTGEWSEKRDFIGETARRLRENPQQLIEAFKKGLRKKNILIK